ncbi:MAG: bifunctional demethylmenaquinone methyltransferase/2-methoxy-6-polyprenyl-1,4-benzoquinol methylase UbiE [Syntrophorhabdaceae bacterium]|nr:bifunctional demethylmenaquinone methyltransferase/2-methoxy-6-polyprenyl-1,4-benzoquinol methylase UbiE [Syntrophorhabdaceae bacterium]
MEKPPKNRYPSVRHISSAEHRGIVKEIFSTITGRYDLLNHVLSMGIDIYWRRFAVKKMRFFKTFRLLDVATGTGDVAVCASAVHPDIGITGLDFIQNMLKAGKAKISRKGLGQKISLVQGDAESLPFSDNTFDVVSIAFGIRNIPDRKAAIEEMIRVLVPGGRLMVLEMTFARRSLFRNAIRLYLNRILPFIAGRITANPGAYHYLADSIMNFPPPAEFAGSLEGLGLKEVAVHSLTFGTTCLYIGLKPS